MWYGAVLALLGAAGIYLSADYVRRHPESLVGQCVVTTCQAGKMCCPAAEVGGAAVDRTFEAIRKVMDEPDMAPTTARVAPDDPEPLLADPVPDVEACPKPEPREEPRLLGQVVIQPDAEEPATDKGPASGAAEEAEMPPPMPPARDDADVPPPMPYADDQARDVGHGLDFWWKLVEAAEANHQANAAQEECEPGKTGAGDCREDPNYDQHYPGCPHTGSCPRSGSCPACRPDAPVIENKGKPAATEGGSEEQGALPAAHPEMPKCGAGAKATRRQGLDTTEFRPSDGKPFDFGSFPY
jgi:hypothetical protein